MKIQIVERDENYDWWAWPQGHSIDPDGSGNWAWFREGAWEVQFNQPWDDNWQQASHPRLKVAISKCLAKYMAQC